MTTKSLINKYLSEQIKSAGSISRSEIKQKYKGEVELVELDETIKSHFILSPINIINSQYWISMLVVSLSLALTVVRVGNDVAIIAFVTAVSVALSLPFILFAQLMKTKFSLIKTRNIGIISAAYLTGLSVALAIYTVSAEMLILMIVPTAIIVFFIWELRKCFELIDYLNNITTKNSQL